MDHVDVRKKGSLNASKPILRLPSMTPEIQGQEFIPHILLGSTAPLVRIMAGVARGTGYAIFLKRIMAKAG